MVLLYALSVALTTYVEQDEDTQGNDSEIEPNE